MIIFIDPADTIVALIDQINNKRWAGWLYVLTNTNQGSPSGCQIFQLFSHPPHIKHVT